MPGELARARQVGWWRDAAGRALGVKAAQRRERRRVGGRRARGGAADDRPTPWIKDAHAQLLHKPDRTCCRCAQPRILEVDVTPMKKGFLNGARMTLVTGAAASLAAAPDNLLAASSVRARLAAGAVPLRVEADFVTCSQVR